MFKNEISFTNAHNISKKEKKDILSILSKTYSQEYIDYMNLNFKTLSIQKGNVSNHKRNFIFYENNPILFEYDIKYYLPTVYLLQLLSKGIANNVLHKVCLIYDATVEYILNGADLMLKGVLNRNEIKSGFNFSLGDIFYVQTISGRIVGLGSVLVSKETMNIDEPTGKFLKIIHREEDALWSTGSKKYLDSVMIQITNENKTEEIINDIKQGKSNEKIDNNQPKEDNKIEGEIEVKEEKIEADKEGEKEEQEENIEEDKKENKEQEPLFTQEDIDEHIDIVFLTLCKLHLNKEKFPMDPGKLYQQFMKPLSEELKLFIDIKQSSYKKINNYFKHLHKDKGLITFSKAKNQNNDYIQSINYNHDMLKSFQPRIKKIKFLSVTDSSEHENILLSKSEKIEVQTIYKPNQKIKPLFIRYLGEEIFNSNAPQFFNIKQCTEILQTYLKDNNLFLTDKPGHVKLDAYLISLLSVHINPFHEEEAIFKMDEIIEMWKLNLTEKNCIMKIDNDTHNEMEMVYTNKLQIRIIARKINNKNVTLVSGLENFIDLSTVTKSLSKHFATSVTIKEDISGLKNAVFIQGYWVNELITTLVEEFKLKKNLIKVEDRLKLKSKKK